MRRFVARFSLAVALIGTASIALPGLAWARLSGLNNIPTADIFPTGTYLLQAWSLFGEDMQTQYAVGLRVGVSPRAEATVDNWRVAPTPTGDTLLAAKYRLSAAAKPLSYAFGVTDVGAGKENPFVVASRQFERFRGHLGFKAQEDNEGFSLGFERWLGQKLLVRGDLVQVNQGDDLLSSLGFLHLGEGRSIVEGWVQFNSAEGGKAAFVLNYNYFFEGR